MARDIAGDVNTNATHQLYSYQVYDLVNDSRFWKASLQNTAAQQPVEYATGDLGVLYIVNQPPIHVTLTLQTSRNY